MFTLFVSTAYVPSPRIRQLDNSSGRSVAVWFFSEDFGLCKYQQPEPAEGGGVECGVWLMGQKDPVKQAVQSLIYTLNGKLDGWISKHFKRKLIQRFVQIIMFPIFLPGYFSKWSSVIQKVTDLWIFQLEVTNDAPLKWVTFSPKGRPPGEDFAPARWCRTCGEWESR